jgi:membrane protease subunit (stomatin/prohibitin family)
MPVLKLIEWANQDRNNIIFKFPVGSRDTIARGSRVTVREGQAAIFATKGQMADVFLPGFHTLDTNSIPVLTRLMGWKFGFRDPFISEIYFVNTTRFINQKWGTTSPIILNDPAYGAIMVRGFGTYEFRVDDPFIFMKEISGTLRSFDTKDINDYLRSKLIAGLANALGQSGLSILEMSANTLELGKRVQETLNEMVKEMGLELTRFNFENFSLPDELQKALKENTALNMKRQSMDVRMQMAQMDALKAAASNPGAGNVMGPAMGMGMGFGMGNMMGNMMQPMMGNMMQNQGMMPNQGMQQQAPAAAPAAGAKFCGECGTAATGGRFCQNCGKPLA